VPLDGQNGHNRPLAAIDLPSPEKLRKIDGVALVGVHPTAN
jgi:hypothetical protein